jgi:hypothetical protein
MSKPKRYCQNCNWWRGPKGKNAIDRTAVGECRRHAPVSPQYEVPMANMTFRPFVRTRSDDDCGDWAER